MGFSGKTFLEIYFFLGITFFLRKVLGKEFSENCHAIEHVFMYRMSNDVLADMAEGIFTMCRDHKSAERAII